MDGEAQILNEQSRKQMILPIYTYGQPVLRKETEEIDADYPNLKQIIQDMWDTLERSHGVGLAAPQVGLPIRLAIIDLDCISEEEPQYEGYKRTFINPYIEEVDDSVMETQEEGCLSLPGRWGLCTRPDTVTVEATNRRGERFRVTGYDLTARCFCHELDHLDGIVYTEVMERFLTEEELMGDEEE